MEARQKALLAAMEDMLKYLSSEKGQVAIFDATNTTEERRQFLVSAAAAARQPHCKLRRSMRGT